METRQKRRTVVVSVLVLAGTFMFSLFAAGGNLEPSGPPGPTMKTLAEVEPRISVQSLGGDANSLYVISQPGSYYLTGNITGEPNKDGIMIAANNVTVDLMGFSLIGVPCSGRGIVKVIDQASPHLHSYPIRIRNGTICNWGGGGMNFEEIKVTYDGGSGVGTSGVLPPKVLVPCHLYLEGVSVHNNDSDGIRVHNALAHMEDVSFAYNGGNGVYLGSGSHTYMKQVSIAHNGGHGLYVDANSCIHMEDVSSFYNTGHGVMVCMMTNLDAYSGYQSSFSHNGGNGMYIANGSCSHIENLSFNNNDGKGMYIGSESYTHMEQVSFRGNNSDGLYVDANSCCFMKGVSFSNNGGHGVFAMVYGMLDAFGVLAPHNGGGGIIINGSGNLNQCTVVGNGGSGIEAGTGSTVRNCTARGNTGDGIVVSSKCQVVGNTCEGNGVGVIGATDPAGIRATGSANRIEANHVIGNNIGIDVDTAGNLIIKNSAQGNSTNYDIALGNTAGPTLGTGDIVSDNPHANYEF